MQYNYPNLSFLSQRCVQVNTLQYLFYLECLKQLMQSIHESFSTLNLS